MTAACCNCNGFINEGEKVFVVGCDCKNEWCMDEIGNEYYGKYICNVCMTNDPYIASCCVHCEHTYYFHRFEQYSYAKCRKCQGLVCLECIPADKRHSIHCNVCKRNCKVQEISNKQSAEDMTMAHSLILLRNIPTKKNLETDYYDGHGIFLPEKNLHDLITLFTTNNGYEVLDLSSNDLNNNDLEYLPDILDLLPNCKYLDLSFNNISGITEQQIDIYVNRLMIALQQKNIICLLYYNPIATCSLYLQFYWPMLSSSMVLLFSMDVIENNRWSTIMGCGYNHECIKQGQISGLSKLPDKFKWWKKIATITKKNK